MASSRASTQDIAAPGNDLCRQSEGERVYQQTFIDTYAKVARAKLYDRKTPITKTPITVADLLNNRVIPFFDGHDIKLLRVLTDRGSEYCGNPEWHDYELYLAVEDMAQPKPRGRRPMASVNACTRPCSTSSTV